MTRLGTSTTAYTTKQVAFDVDALPEEVSPNDVETEDRGSRSYAGSRRGGARVVSGGKLE